MVNVIPFFRVKPKRGRILVIFLDSHTVKKIGILQSRIWNKYSLPDCKYTFLSL